MLRARCLFSLKSSLFAQNQYNNLKTSRLCLIRAPHFSTDTNKTSTADSAVENIYNGPLTSQIKMVKVFSLTTSVVGVIGQPVIYNQANIIGGVPVVVAVCGIVGFFTFVTPLLLHIITKKYITTIDYNKSSDTYIATVLTFFLQKKKVSFTTNDIVVPDVPGMFTSFFVNKRPVFVDYRQFKDPNHYVKMMGFDKPIDFEMRKLDTIENDVNDKK